MYVGFVNVIERDTFIHSGLLHQNLTKMVTATAAIKAAATIVRQLIAMLQLPCLWNRKFLNSHPILIAVLIKGFVFLFTIFRISFFLFLFLTSRYCEWEKLLLKKWKKLKIIVIASKSQQNESDNLSLRLMLPIFIDLSNFVFYENFTKPPLAVVKYYCWGIFFCLNTISSFLVYS